MNKNEISTVIKSLFPNYLQDVTDHKLVLFFEAYYDWMMKSSNPETGETRGPLEFFTNLLKYRDLDDNPELHDSEFVQHNVNNIIALLPNVPTDGDLDITTLTKNLKSFLISKGSIQSIEFLFNSFFEPPEFGQRETVVKYARDYVLRTNATSIQSNNESIIYVKTVDFPELQIILDNKDRPVKIQQYNATSKNVTRWCYIDSYRVLGTDGLYTKVGVYYGEHNYSDLLVGSGVESIIICDNPQYDFDFITTNALGVSNETITNIIDGSITLFKLPSYKPVDVYEVYSNRLIKLEPNSNYGVLYKISKKFECTVKPIVTKLNIGTRFNKVGDPIYVNGQLLGKVTRVKQSGLDRYVIKDGGTGFTVGDTIKITGSTFNAIVTAVSSTVITEVKIINPGFEFTYPQLADTFGTTNTVYTKPSIVFYGSNIGEVITSNISNHYNATTYDVITLLRVIINTSGININPIGTRVALLNASNTVLGYGVVKDIDVERSIVTILPETVFDSTLATKLKNTTYNTIANISVTNYVTSSVSTSGTLVKLSNSKVNGSLNDSDARLTGEKTHDYAYTIQSDLPPARWHNVVKNLTHPVGYRFFGEHKITFIGKMTYAVEQLISTAAVVKLPGIRLDHPPVQKTLGWLNSNILSNGSLVNELIALDANGSRLLLNNNNEKLLSGRSIILNTSMSLSQILNVPVSSMVNSSVPITIKMKTAFIKDEIVPPVVDNQVTSKWTNNISIMTPWSNNINLTIPWV